MARELHSPAAHGTEATEVTVSNTSGRFHQGRMSVSPAVEELTGWWTLTSPSVQARRMPVIPPLTGWECGGGKCFGKCPGTSTAGGNYGMPPT